MHSFDESKFISSIAFIIVIMICFNKPDLEISLMKYN